MKGWFQGEGELFTVCGKHAGAGGRPGFAPVVKPSGILNEKP
ncbi:MAG TPA: hypothetical protein VNE82_20070 [Candidatus Binataceae bacterium]|nr:hypothetical protein [Candidatus Binataceae bacterium]